jgi:hypothetical protein
MKVEKTAWCTDYWQGRVPVQGVVVEGVKGGKQAPKPAEIHKKWAKNGWFPALFGLTITKTPFSTQKYFIRYMSRHLLNPYGEIGSGFSSMSIIVISLLLPLLDKDGTV